MKKIEHRSQFFQKPLMVAIFVFLTFNVGIFFFPRSSIGHFFVSSRNAKNFQRFLSEEKIKGEDFAAITWYPHYGRELTVKIEGKTDQVVDQVYRQVKARFMQSNLFDDFDYAGMLKRLSLNRQGDLETKLSTYAECWDVYQTAKTQIDLLEGNFVFNSAKVEEISTILNEVKALYANISCSSQQADALLHQVVMGEVNKKLANYLIRRKSVPDDLAPFILMGQFPSSRQLFIQANALAMTIFLIYFLLRKVLPLIK